MSRQELLEKMQKAWDLAPMQGPNASMAAMDAALSVAIDELLKEPTNNEIAAEWEDGKIHGYGADIKNFIASRRARLERVKTPEERVTVVRLPVGADVLVDQDWQLHFDTDQQAEIYRLGLIQQLKSSA